jgi:hypothetical protein
MTHKIRVAMKLIPPFKENKSEVLACMGNTGPAFSVINPNLEDKKSVSTWVSGQPIINIMHRNLDSWIELKKISENVGYQKKDA